MTGTCWCYSAISFLESEILRQQGKRIKLSEMFVVYHEYLAKARRFVKKHGDSNFPHGSEAIGVLRMIAKHGIMPYQAYPGKKTGQKFHDHSHMFKELKNFLNTVKEQDIWNEEFVLNTFRSIMESYMGKIPKSFTFKGKSYTPETFRDYTGFDSKDYYAFMSTMSKPFYEKGELVEFDNWWHSDEFYNLPAQDFMHLINESLKAGYTLSICGDISEPGHNNKKEVSLIPDFDIPAPYINDQARQLRFENESTTDDHCIHIIGYQKVNDIMWYMIKDSGSGGFDGKHAGYRFFREDYVKLKMMNIIVHKDTAKEILERTIK
jgi:bleomycin hydrolase